MIKNINSECDHKFADFKYVVLPGSNPKNEDRVIYDHVFQTWFEVWKDAFAELRVDKTVNSDAFTRQDFIGSLFYKGQCFAMALFKVVNTANSEVKFDSYFHNWRPEHIAKLSANGNSVLVCSYFTVHPLGRSKKLGLSGKDLMLGMLVETFMNVNVDAMTGAARINKGVNEVCLRWGASLIESDVDSGLNANVDLLGFFKNVILTSQPHELKSLCSQLWQDCQFLAKENVFDLFIPNKNLKIAV